MKTTLTDGSPVTSDHTEINPETGLQKGYMVLSEEERAQGFVEPVRYSYNHVGMKVCGHMIDDTNMCIDDPGHEDEHGNVAMQVSEDEIARFEQTGFLKGCGSTTTMGASIAETYARNPNFYNGTFCTNCRTHFPVGPEGEFVWSGTLQRVGTRQKLPV